MRVSEAAQPRHRGPGSYRKPDAHGGREGARNELALVKLDQQRRLPHATVSNQDCLQGPVKRCQHAGAGDVELASMARSGPAFGEGVLWNMAVNRAGSGGISSAPAHGRAMSPMTQLLCTALLDSRLSPRAAGCKCCSQMACPSVSCPSLSLLVLPPAWGGISTPLTMSVVNRTHPRLSSVPELRCASLRAERWKRKQSATHHREQAAEMLLP